MSAIVFDIETGPVPEEQLRAVYHEPTFEEFCESCDQRWKEDTRKAKFEEAKAAGWAKFVDRAALSPLTGQVLAIGLRSEKGAAIMGDDQEGEAAALAAFWQKYRQCAQAGRRLVGFNVFGFDLPFLIRRSWLHSVAVPSSVIEKSRYWSHVFVDLMAVWGCGIYGERGSLDTLSRYFGVGGKPDGVCGGDFAGLWFGGVESREQAMKYLWNDLDMTWRLAERMGVIV